MNPTVLGLSTPPLDEIRAAKDFNASIVNVFSSASIELSSIATEYSAEHAIAAIASRRRA